MALSLVGCGIAFQDVGYGDVKHRVVLCLLPPFVVAVNVREGCHFPAFQDHQSVIELTFASGGQPDVFGEKEGSDDCGLLRLHQRHIGIDLILEQMLAEQALGESPLRRKQVRSLEIGVHPHYRREMVILDAVAGLRVVWDDFPAAAATLDVKLKKRWCGLWQLYLCGIVKFHTNSTMTHKFAMESLFYRLPCIGERLVHGLKLDSTLLDGI